MTPAALHSIRLSFTDGLDDLVRFCRARTTADLGPVLRVDIDPGNVWRVRFLGGGVVVRPDGAEVVLDVRRSSWEAARC